MKSPYYLLLLCLGVLSCVTSQTTPIASGNASLTQALDDTGTITIFLLERDLPAQFDRLGVVAISPHFTSANPEYTDSRVKAELRKKCQNLGANGAIRILDGTYEPNIVSYLVFRYDKSALVSSN